MGLGCKFGVWGSGLWVQGPGCKVIYIMQGAGWVEGAGCRAHGAGTRVQGVRCRMQRVTCRMQDAGYMVQGAGCKEQDARCRVQGAGARVYGVRCRVQGAGEQGWVVPIWPSSLSARAKYDGTRISWHEGFRVEV